MCDYCAKARHIADYPLYQAQCKGCAVRALAQGPDFHRSSADGRLDPSYRRALGLIFGDDWRTGHDQVKAEHARIRDARALL